MDIVYGHYLTGMGLLFRIADVWAGTKSISDEPHVLLENVETGKFAWLGMSDIKKHFEEVNYAT